MTSSTSVFVIRYCRISIYNYVTMTAILQAIVSAVGERIDEVNAHMTL